jgi:NAD+ synthase (glutamine-hydrolysing)
MNNSTSSWNSPRHHGYLRVAAARPTLHLANPSKNAAEHITMLEDLTKAGVQVAVFPEMSLTGYTVEDYLNSETLLDAAVQALRTVLQASRNLPIFALIGMPLRVGDVLINASIGISSGLIRAIWPKTYLPNYREFYDARWFASASDLAVTDVALLGRQVPIGNDILIELQEFPHATLHAEICEDGWMPIPPSTHAALAGATVLCNLSASNFGVAKAEFRSNVLMQAASARLYAAMVYSSSGYGESTRDLVWDGDAYIAENGALLAQARRFDIEPGYIVADVHPGMMVAERRKMNTFSDNSAAQRSKFRTVSVTGILSKRVDQTLHRTISTSPFVPTDPTEQQSRASEMFCAQAQALAHRMQSAKAQHLVIGLSGGLDSTLAFLVAYKALELRRLPATHLIAVTMPGFGTTGRTKTNAQKLAKAMGVTLETHSIVKASKQVLRDIRHNGAPDLAYENVQARERTAHLFHRANMVNCLVVGTGDLSELALGWCTYMGDHMSSYNVNCSVPKTMVKMLVRWYISSVTDQEIRKVLTDILATLISPELLPTDSNGNSAQETESIVGPYELHDFFVYYHVRHGLTPEHLLFLAKRAFTDAHDTSTIAKWLRVFYTRFVTQQFKRDVAPPGPKLGSVTLSPRGDWRCPPDIVGNIWVEALDRLLSTLDSDQ